MELTYCTLKNKTKKVFVPCEANLTSLDEFYAHQAPSRQEDYLAFKEHWGTGQKNFFAPRAAAKQLNKKEIAEFGFDLSDKLFFGAQKVYAAVWTLGNALENYVNYLMANNNLTAGLMLDVAGSVALRNIRHDLINWVDTHSRGKARFVCAEYYPGLKVFPLKFVPRVLEITDAYNILGVSASENCFLTPAKTKCAFFFLGQEAHKTAPIRCIPCLDKKCLYWQMGGCHMLFLDDAPTH
ncbi:MAG: hypothetical protein Q4C78_02815 [Synergistaceae bacterium]|nr:hypothetical protein [Synergistaceae bacterium]